MKFSSSSTLNIQFTLRQIRRFFNALFVIKFFILRNLFRINYSKTLELSWNIDPNRIEFKQISSIESNFFNISMFFHKNHSMHQIHHVNHSNAIKQCSFRSNRTRKNIEILKNFGSRELIFNSIRVR